MEIPLQITFRNIDPSPAIEQDIHMKARHLARFSDRIRTCRVVIEARHQSHHQGTLYNCFIDLEVPQRRISVGRVGPKDHGHENVYVAIRDSFDATARQLENHIGRMRGEVKTHAQPPEGTIVRLLDGYGFIELPDGQEIYFHENSVKKDSFTKLSVGQKVHLSINDKDGVDGPQATSVRPI